MIPIFRNIEERSIATNYCPVNLLSVLSKAFEKLNRINNRIVDCLEKCGLFSEKCGLFSDFQYGFRSS